jgi:hypothetical protein
LCGYLLLKQFLDYFIDFWAFPEHVGLADGRGASFLQSPNSKLNCVTLAIFGHFPAGRALRCNLFSRSSQKGFLPVGGRQIHFNP